MFKINQSSVKALVSCFSVVALVSCAGIRAGTHYDEKYYFDGYKTFSWLSKEPIQNSENGTANISPLTLKKIVQSVQSELIDRGYQYTDDLDNADFSLTYTVGSREALSMNSFPVGFRHDWDWYWHGNYHTYNQWHVQTWTEGTLTIDIFDNNTKEPIWHGWATKSVTKSDRKDPTNSIKKAVGKIFKDFPSIN